MKLFPRIYVEITNSCNFNCSFCRKSNRDIRFMTKEEFKNIVEDIKEYTDLIMLHIKGEPLLHPELKSILESTKMAKLKANITTNGSLLNKNLEALKIDSVRQLNISLHSINEDKTNSNINFDTYIKNIFDSVKILRENNPNIYISYRLWNLKDITENSENYNIISALEKEYKIKDLNVLAKENSFVELDSKIFLNQDIEFVWPSMEDKIVSETGRCLGLKEQIGILSDGRVVPCCLDQDGNVELGNIFSQSFKSIIESDYFREILNGFYSNRIIPELCKRCTYRLKFSK